MTAPVSRAASAPDRPFTLAELERVIELARDAVGPVCLGCGKPVPDPLIDYAFVRGAVFLMCHLCLEGLPS